MLVSQRFAPAESSFGRRAIMDADWFHAHSTLFYIITASVLGSITLLCAYFLWRGPLRPAFPCLPTRRARTTSPSPIPAITPSNRSTTSLPSDEKRSIRVLPPAANTDWTQARRTSKLLLADLESNWGVKQKEASRKIRKPPPKSPATPTSAHTFGHGRSPSSAAHAISVAATTSSFGHAPDEQFFPSPPILGARSAQGEPAGPGTPESIIQFTAPYSHPTPHTGQPIYAPSPRTPYTPYSPPSAYPTTPGTAYIPSRAINASSTSLSIPSEHYPNPHGLTSCEPKPVFVPVHTPPLPTPSRAMSEETAAQQEDGAPVFDFSRPASQDYFGPTWSTATHKASSEPPALPRHSSLPLQPSLPSIDPGSPFTPFPTPPARPTHSPLQSILRKSVDSTASSHSRKSSTSTSSVTSSFVSTGEVPSISVTAPPLARVKRASYAASRLSMKSVKPPPSPLRQIVK